MSKWVMKLLITKKTCREWGDWHIGDCGNRDSHSWQDDGVAMKEADENTVLGIDFFVIMF